MSTAAAQDASPVYGLHRPRLTDARGSLHRTLEDPAPVWDQVLAGAGLTGTETGTDALLTLAHVMMARGGVVEQCGRALDIRMRAFLGLEEVRALIAAARV
ncbi:hypothetical protein COUCH_24015 [Couchioplanes caeruleus]|uniref:hypothetical protein n=1 Tax=Couchioplanes caeruleus TaxID=56438 RepID=UPI0020C0E427|nr:hypothetical protein [Couchioplanes caeruleus]UQU62101.1 hypothetical protein COUCH_24015 [Couchioplanes caeruleus]